MYVSKNYYQTARSILELDRANKTNSKFFDTGSCEEHQLVSSFIASLQKTNFFDSEHVNKFTQAVTNSLDLLEGKTLTLTNTQKIFVILSFGLLYKRFVESNSKSIEQVKESIKSMLDNKIITITINNKEDMEYIRDLLKGVSDAQKNDAYRSSSEFLFEHLESIIDKGSQKSFFQDVNFNLKIENKIPQKNSKYPVLEDSYGYDYSLLKQRDVKANQIIRRYLFNKHISAKHSEILDFKSHPPLVRELRDAGFFHNYHGLSNGPLAERCYANTLFDHFMSHVMLSSGNINLLIEYLDHERDGSNIKKEAIFKFLEFSKKYFDPEQSVSADDASMAWENLCRAFFKESGQQDLDDLLSTLTKGICQVFQDSVNQGALSEADKNGVMARLRKQFGFLEYIFPLQKENESVQEGKPQQDLCLRLPLRMSMREKGYYVVTSQVVEDMAVFLEKITVIEDTSSIKDATLHEDMLPVSGSDDATEGMQPGAEGVIPPDDTTSPLIEGVPPLPLRQMTVLDKQQMGSGIFLHLQASVLNKRRCLQKPKSGLGVHDYLNGFGNVQPGPINLPLLDRRKLPEQKDGRRTLEDYQQALQHVKTGRPDYIVIHKGKLGKGHYFALRRLGDYWIKIDDTRVTLLRELDPKWQAYLVHYPLPSIVENQTAPDHVGG